MDIVTAPNKILQRKLKKVEKITPEIKQLAEAMKKKMLESDGVGLSANQIGRDLQLCVIHPSVAKEAGVPEIFINPEITEYSKEKEDMEEGCLSIPGHFAFTKRAKKIRVKALNLEGKRLRFRARGLLARILQHEIDHLNGKLIKDKEE